MPFEITPPVEADSPRRAFDASGGMVDDAAIEAFRHDGVVCLRRVIDPDSLPALLAGCDQARAEPTSMAYAIGSDGPSFFYDFDVSERIDAFRRLRDESAMTDLAQRLMGSRRLARYFDKLFIKDGGGGAATPWQRALGAESNRCDLNAPTHHRHHSRLLRWVRRQFPSDARPQALPAIGDPVSSQGAVWSFQELLLAGVVA